VFVALFCVAKAQQRVKKYQHRRQWVEDKLLELGQVFAIDGCAPREDTPEGLPYRLVDYIELVELTGRMETNRETNRTAKLRKINLSSF
jgi:hypothetical protein